MAHLLPGDGLEAVAVALCGRRRSQTHHCLTVRKLVPIPYNECKVRTRERVTWSTQRLIPLLELAEKHDLAILKIHSHPGGYRDFSPTDDESDKDLFNSVFGWTDSAYPHVSAVMLPSGRMFGRAILPDGTFQPLDSILVPGDDLHFWIPEGSGKLPSFALRHTQLFGSGTIRRLREMAIAVVGCSGTGSPLIEQLARLGVGRLVLIDPDRVELKNLNRILNATREDAYLKRPKVEGTRDCCNGFRYGSRDHRRRSGNPRCREGRGRVRHGFRLHGWGRGTPPPQPPRGVLCAAVFRCRGQIGRRRPRRRQRGVWCRTLCSARWRNLGGP
jgi:hypothetical protein